MVFFVRHRIKNANALAPHTARQQTLKLKSPKGSYDLKSYNNNYYVLLDYEIPVN
ncbi:hypothetical protein T11_12067 [Trichinella zimbabwensis]|uniref:Uncharacterized protein n=1 Tax=Trichinella zimbabwensis TaxID=268475 RepID=A0A0V1GIY3_9BILA|nr:hypothetical protein T11_12067 [Trichinella zimbabwensis]